MGHALVVGGTGMLWGVCEWLAARGEQVTVVSRSGCARSGASVRGIAHLAVDYRDGAALERALRAAAEERGPWALAVCWVRSDAGDVPGTIRRLVPACRVIRVVGSEGARHVADAGSERVVRGWVIGADGPRWLTDAEIAAGVIGAIRGAAPDVTIGEPRPAAFGR